MPLSESNSDCGRREKSDFDLWTKHDGNSWNKRSSGVFVVSEAQLFFEVPIVEGTDK